MKKISNPGNGCVSMFVIQSVNLFFDDFFSLWAALGIVVKLELTFSCNDFFTVKN